MDIERLFVIVGSIIMFIGVGSGAFGAHALSSYFESHPDLQSTFETAVRYLMIHGLAILAVAWASGRWPGGLINIAGFLFVAGILIFSGSLFILSLTGIRWLGAITPIGGAAFLAGWLFLIIGVWRSQ
jgi:uncharacterized membrane protein YgdD (TMEM256/DUF423 family)